MLKYEENCRLEGNSSNFMVNIRNRGFQHNLKQVSTEGVEGKCNHINWSLSFLSWCTKGSLLGTRKICMGSSTLVNLDLTAMGLERVHLQGDREAESPNLWKFHLGESLAVLYVT